MEVDRPRSAGTTTPSLLLAGLCFGLIKCFLRIYETEPHPKSLHDEYYIKQAQLRVV
jgi:hypothetical protein